MSGGVKGTDLLPLREGRGEVDTQFLIKWEGEQWPADWRVDWRTSAVNVTAYLYLQRVEPCVTFSHAWRDTDTGYMVVLTVHLPVESRLSADLRPLWKDVGDFALSRVKEKLA